MIAQFLVEAELPCEPTPAQQREIANQIALALARRGVFHPSLFDVKPLEEVSSQQSVVSSTEAKATDHGPRTTDSAE